MGKICFHRNPKGLNTKSTMTMAQLHNSRKKFCENADPEKSDQNRMLVDRGMAFDEYFAKRMREAYVPRLHPKTQKPIAMKKNAVKILDLLISVNANELATNPLFDLDEFLTRSKQFIVDVFDEKNIVAMVYHADEGAPHIHIQVIPLTPDGRLDSHYFTSKSKLPQLQTMIADRMKDLGLVRGRERSVVDHRTIKQYHADLGVAQVVTLPEPELCETIDNYKARVTAAVRVMQSQHFAQNEKKDAEIRDLETTVRQLEAVSVDELESEIARLKEKVNEKEKALEAAARSSSQWADVACAVQRHLLDEDKEKKLSELVREAYVAGRNYRAAREAEKQKISHDER